MSVFKKKDKPPTAVYVTNLDYDKLADAIVRAQTEPGKKQDNEVTKPDLKRTLKAIGDILCGKRSKDGKYLSAPFSIIVSLLYRAIAIVGVLMLILVLVAIITALRSANWQGWAVAENVFLIIFAAFFSLVTLLYMLLFWGAANDMEYEQDKNYVAAAFSGVVSVAALVVAIIAIFRT